MNCTEARELLLEADLVELRGEGLSPLARHLASCAECRRAAAHLLDTTRLLADALESRPHPRRRPHVVQWSLAAAASLAVIFVAVRSQGSNDGATTLPAAAPSHGAEVSAANGRSVAVFRTADPNITVVWFF